MANQLLRVRDAPPVGKLWAHNFVKLQPELRTRWTRRHNYQRAGCKDSKVIGEWFALIRNIQTKYGTGFMMGIIFAGMVVTGRLTVNAHQDSHYQPSKLLPDFDVSCYIPADQG